MDGFQQKPAIPYTSNQSINEQPQASSVPSPYVLCNPEILSEVVAGPALVPMSWEI